MSNKSPKTTGEHLVALYGHITGLKREIYSIKKNHLGHMQKEIDKLQEFRSKGNYINSVKQFQQVTGIKDSLLNVISPYFKFPKWNTSKKNTPKNTIKKPIIKQDINLAKISDLRIVNGIGEKLANRIIQYRTKLQGFSFNSQLYEVWNLDKEVVGRVLLHFEVITPPTIKKINVNEATFKQVLSIVYIDYELTKKILNYRDEVAEIQSIEELKKIDDFPLEKFDRIALYLEAK